MGRTIVKRVFVWREMDGYTAALSLSHERKHETVKVVPEPLPGKRPFIRVTESVVKRPFIMD